jgi:hypothetical protein
MNVVRTAVSFIAVLGIACDRTPTLPPAELLVEDDAIGSVTVEADSLYWTASVGGEANFTGRVMRMSRGVGREQEVLAEHQFNPRGVVAGARALYWGNTGDIVSCGGLIALGEDGAPQPIAQNLVCHGFPVAVAGGKVTVLGWGEHRATFIDVDEETRSASLRLAMDDQVAGLAATSSGIYLIIQDRGGGYLARLPHGQTALEHFSATGIRSPAGLTVAERHLYWVDGNIGRGPQQIFRTRSNRSGSLELVAEVEPELWIGRPTYAGGAVWLVGAGGTNEDPTGWLLRVDTEDGSIERYPVDYLPEVIMAGDDDELVVLTRPRYGDAMATPSQILSQPLPR